MAGCKKTVLFSLVIGKQRLALIRQVGQRKGRQYEEHYVSFQYQYQDYVKKCLVWLERSRTESMTADAARSTLIRWACIHFKLDAYGPELPTLETLAMLSQGGE